MYGNSPRVLDVLRWPFVSPKNTTDFMRNEGCLMEHFKTWVFLKEKCGCYKQKLEFYMEK